MCHVKAATSNVKSLPTSLCPAAYLPAAKTLGIESAAAHIESDRQQTGSGAGATGLPNSASSNSITGNSTNNGGPASTQSSNNGSASGLTHTHGSHYFVHGGANTNVVAATGGPQALAGLGQAESSNGRRPSDYIRLRSAIYEKHLKHKVSVSLKPALANEAWY